MSDVIVVEARANIALRNAHGQSVTLIGETAVARSLIQANLDALPETTLRVLTREATKEEVHLSTDRGLIPHANPAGSGGSDGAGAADAAPSLAELKRPELLAFAKRVGVPGSGTNADIVKEIEDLAAAAQVSTDGPAQDVVAAIEATQEVSD